MDPTETRTQVRERFAALVAQPDASIDLGEAALLIGAEAEPGVDVGRWLGRLDGLAADAQQRVRAARSPAAQVRELCRVLYDDYGLRGNRDAYEDPWNSYLHRVLERGLGIPISLAVILLEVARRVGVPLQGVSFPAHFLVRHRDAELVLDPFEGRMITVDDCRALLERASGGKVAFDARLLRPATNREILARMLRNLKALHVARGEVALALSVVERLLLLKPGDVDEGRDRGLLLVAAGRPGRGLPDLDRYLAERPTATDVKAVRDQRDQARARLWSMN